MNSYLLILALVVTVLLMVEHIVLAIIVAVVFYIWYCRHYLKNRKRTFGVLCIALLYLMFPAKIAEPMLLEGKVVDIKQSYCIVQLHDQKVLVYGVEDVNFNDWISFQGTYEQIDGSHNFHSFYFPDYMRKKGIFYSIQAKEYEMKQEGKGLRHQMYKRVSSMEEEQKTWLKASLFQMKDTTSPSLIASSGMHLSFLFFSIQNILQKWLKKKHAKVVTLVSLMLFGCMFGFSSSLYRILCFQIGNLWLEKKSSYERLGFSMLLTLALMPSIASQMSFVLPVMFRLVQLFQKRKLPKFMITLLVCIPIQLYFFSSCNFIQILCFPLLRLLYSVHYLVAFCMFVFPNSYFYVVGNTLLSMIGWIEAWEFTLWYVPHLLWLYVWIRWGISYITFETVRLYKGVLLLMFAWIAPYLNPFGEVYMFDIGQGDCTLITLPFHQGNILIDVAGNEYKDNVSDIVLPVLRAKGIHRIDQVIVTHDDFDHSGGVERLCELIEVKEVITEKQPYISWKDTNLAVLSHDIEGKDSNDQSLVLLFETSQLKFLFMGDASVEIEKQIMEKYPLLEVDILKVGHHGSHTSTSSAFLQQMHPSMALISCGRNNRYNHPSSEVVKRLEENHVFIADTSKQGAISIKYSKFFQFFRTAKQEFGIISIGDKE